MRIIGALGIAAIVCGCAAGVETTPVAVELPPAEVRVIKVGDERVVRELDGSERTSRVTRVDGTMFTIEDSEGCSYTAAIDGFGPSTTYENCDGASGTQTLTRTGMIFPLQVGKTESWAITGSDNRGNRWENTRTCVVEGTAQVSVPAGTFPTYHVVCRDDWNTRSFYYSPDLELVVAYERTRRGRADREGWQLVEFRPADG